MPQPTTTGGGLMSYAPTVDTGQISPVIIQYPGIENAAVTAVVVAGSAYFQVINLYVPVTLTQMRSWFSGSPTGQVDMGIYDSTGTNGQPDNLLGHTGANAAAPGLFTKSLTANLPLSPGVYWLAFLDTVADSLSTRSTAVAGLGALYKTNATNLTVLPSTAGTIANNTLLIEMYALVLNGFA